MSKVLIGNFKGPQGEQGIPGIQGEQGERGNRGSRWTEGIAITGTSTTPTVFNGTGISDSLAEDMYLNTDTGNAYRCTTGGEATVAKWVYACNLKGIKGDTGAKGDPGTAGPKGEKGDTGEQGPKGETPTVADNMTVAFTGAATRENISTGEKVSTVFGKIKKFFADLTAPAFAQMITSKEDLLAAKVTGYVPDAKAVADTYTELNGKLTNVYTVLYSNYFAANVTNTVELKDNFQNYKLLLFVCNNGTAQMYAPTVYPALYIKDLYDSVKNGQYLGTYPSITTFIGSTISGSFIPVADNKFKLTTGMSGTFMILGLK